MNIIYPVIPNEPNKTQKAINTIKLLINSKAQTMPWVPDQLSR